MAKNSGGMSDLNTYLKSICKQAAENIGEDVKELIKDFIMIYYSEFSPSEYSRTYNFLDSVTRTEAIPIPNGYKVIIYLDSAGTDYEEVEPIDVWNMANKGSHGGVMINNGNPSDNHFWDDAMEELKGGYITKKFGEYLSSKGLSVNLR